VIYPKYWLVPKAKTTFIGHQVAIIHVHFAYLKAWVFFGIFGGFILNLALLDDQFVFFKLTMQNPYQVGVACPKLQHDYPFVEKVQN
jgi:hypothetical protein